MRDKRRIVVLAITINLLSLCSCSLFPKEAEYDATVLVAASNVEYEYAYVKRGTLAHKEKVVCVYTTAYSEDYAFDIGGENYGGIYVKVGDYVHKGDLLAELEVFDYLKRIEEAEEKISTLERVIRNTGIEAEIAVKRQEILLEEKSEIGKMTLASKEAVLAKYLDEIRMAKMQMDILEGWLDYWNTQVEERRIYATFDGVVSYTKDIATGNTSYSGAKVITVSDDSAALFYASTSLADRFTYGMELIATMDKMEYPVRVVDPAVYNIEPSEKDVYFEVIGTTEGLAAGNKGTISITLEQRDDILYIPEEAVISLDGQEIVFYINEAGVRDFKEIVTGFSTDGYIEILDGLTEGEKIIIG